MLSPYHYQIPQEIIPYIRKTFLPAVLLSLFFIFFFPFFLNIFFTILHPSAGFRLAMVLFSFPVVSLIILTSAAASNTADHGSRWKEFKEKLMLHTEFPFSWKNTVLVFLFTFVLTLVLSNLVDQISRYLGIELPPQDLILIFQQSTLTDKLLIAISAILLAPLSEELIFRHILFNRLALVTNVMTSAVITSAIFSAIHMNWFSAPSLFCLAFMLQLSYIHNRSLLAPIAIHMLFNLFNLAALLLLTFQQT